MRTVAIALASTLLFSTPHVPANPRDVPRRALDGPAASGDAPRHVLAAVDVERLRAEDAWDGGLRPVLRVGLPRRTDLSVRRAGRWDVLANGDRLWRLQVTSPEALWLVLGFESFHPEPGAELRVYDPERRSVLGPYATVDARADGRLWLPPLPGETAVVELLWPAEASREPGLRLAHVSHGYRKAGDDGFMAASPASPVVSDHAGSCNVDVECPLGDDLDHAKRATVQLLIGGAIACTGALVNTTSGDCRPYLITAAHCVDTQAEAAATLVRFRYERPGCESGTTPITPVINGSTLLATSATTDFSLLRLDAEIPEDADAHFLGWDHSGVPATESWTIHHPGADVKKISHDADALVSGPPGGWGSDHWRVTQWEDGTTEPGSSGAPLLDAAGRLLGQLHGGTASCSSTTWDEFGKFSTSWTGGATADSRLRDWLDPLATGQATLEGIDDATCRLPRAELAIAEHEILDGPRGANGVADPGEALTLAVHLRNDGDAWATGVQAELESLDAAATVVQPAAEWPDIPTDDEASSAAPHFRLTLDAGLPCGETVALRLRVTEQGGVTRALDLTLPTGSETTATLFNDDVEQAVAGWSTPQATWHRSDSDSASGQFSWFAQPPGAGDEASLVLDVPGGADGATALRFVHRHALAAGGTGGVLEYSVDGGNAWQDAGAWIVDGGYDATIDLAGSPLAGREAWTGDSDGWEPVVVDLSALGDAPVLFRWRQAGGAGEGWYVDDVVVEETSHSCSTRRSVRTLAQTGRRSATRARSAAHSR